MKNTFGNSLAVTLFGESHGEMTGAVLDGLCPGIPVDTDRLSKELERRRPSGRISTARREEDSFRIVSGVLDGVTTGTPLTILIPNSDRKSSDYEEIRHVPRPGHADYTAYLKYHGFQDYRGGGHFSGRLTAALTAAGALIQPALSKKGIRILTHIALLGGVSDRCPEDPEKDLEMLRNADFPVLDTASGEAMKQAILDALNDHDSLGGETETVVYGLPGGVGEPWFDTAEGILSHALFSIPAVKGIAFGDAFRESFQRGSAFNDAFRVSDGQVVTATNHNGGINGGITNGMPLSFRLFIKPTSSISLPQDSVDLRTMEERSLTIAGRHDPAIIHRACPVIDAVTAIALYDLLASRFGTDWFAV